MDQNHISGKIPEEIGNLAGLKYLDLDTNTLTDRIPDSIGRLADLQEIHLFINQISGEIPSSIGNITGLNVLTLMDNMLEGSIPVSLRNCRELEGLHLESNQLSGSIPPQVLVGLRSLSLGLILADNRLTGSLPTEVGNLKQLASLDLSGNRISGEIPSSLGECEMLDSLHMEHNFFVGTIPSSLGDLKSIEFMDLSNNNLSGKIPDSLGKLKLIKRLNLSFNMLDGEVPNEGIFTNSSDFSVLGNPNLCGGIQFLNLSACPNPTERKASSSRKVIILATTIPVFVLSLFASVFAIYKVRTRPTTRRSPSSLPSTNDYMYPKLSYSELLQSTNGFSSENLIGEGSYGSVYKGILASTEQVVAVKVLKLKEHGAKKSFLAECEALRNLRHRNLVKIITSCSSIDLKGDDFKALVFEYMPNGSLETWLHHHPSSGDDDDEQKKNRKSLSLERRLDIAIDVASALDYLHRDCQTPMIHCDIKPSNVLLDDDFCARVSDFGLSRFLSIKDESNHTNSSSIGIRGTVGYVAPEYGMGGEVSMQGDIYSYGVLLLEMFTGKRPTSSTFTASDTLHNRVKMALPHQVMEIVDPRILPEEEEEEEEEEEDTTNNKTTENGKVHSMERNQSVKDCLASILQVGVSCSDSSPTQRMDVQDVLKELHRIRNRFLQNVDRGY